MQHFPMLSKEENAKLGNWQSELEDAINKDQIYRTETEMRYSVLQDGKHPTPASKYWQCVREQVGMFRQLVDASFHYRRNIVDLEEAKEMIKHENNQFEKQRLQIKIDEISFYLDENIRTAKDRFREMQLWSMLKKELDDGSFDTQDVNTHQPESLKLRLEKRAVTLTSGSSQAEVLNVLGPLGTMGEEYANILDPVKFRKLNSNGHKEENDN